MKQPAVYIVASKRNGTLYIGVTSNLVKRIYEHKHPVIKCFTEKYKCHLLVYYELCDTMEVAIIIEKKLKKLLRIQKLNMIGSKNPEWRDLYDTII